MPQAKTSGFMVFVNEWRNKKGTKMSLQSAVNEAGKIWATMNAQQRGPFNSRAKNISYEAKKQEPLNCYGIPLSEVERDQKEMKQKELNMKRTIDKIVRTALNKMELQSTRFYFIMFNYFNKAENSSMLIPAEVAICEFSLEDGMSRVYSTLINPETEIFGSLYEAQSHSLNTHQLPVPPKAKGEKDLKLVYNNLLDFLQPDNIDGGELPPVYTFEEHMGIINSCLQYLNLYAPDQPELNIYSVHYLFYQLKLACAEFADTEPPKSHYVSDAFFNSDHFEYIGGIACDFHEEIDRTKYCAKSRVIRWAYIFSDYMCADLSIEPIPGKHVPLNTKVDFIVRKTSSKSTANTSTVGSTNFDTATCGTTTDDSDILSIKSDADCVSALMHQWNGLAETNKNLDKPTSKTIEENYAKDFPMLSSKKKQKNRKNVANNNSYGDYNYGHEYSMPDFYEKPKSTLKNDNVTNDSIESSILLSDTTSIISSTGRGLGMGRAAYSIISDASNLGLNDSVGKLHGLGRGRAFK